MRVSLTPLCILLGKVSFLQLHLCAVVGKECEHEDCKHETEYAILQDYPHLKVDVLVLGHHGSQHSSSYAFLEKLQPEIAIVSAGFNNRYGHPSEIVQVRLKELNIPVLSTINDGTIQFSQHRNNDVEINKQRDTRLWLKRDFSD